MYLFTCHTGDELWRKESLVGDNGRLGILLKNKWGPARKRTWKLVFCNVQPKRNAEIPSSCLLCFFKSYHFKLCLSFPSFQFPQSLVVLAIPLGLPESFGISWFNCPYYCVIVIYHCVFVCRHCLCNCIIPSTMKSSWLWKSTPGSY